jgi:hypothetical protein
LTPKNTLRGILTLLLDDGHADALLVQNQLLLGATIRINTVFSIIIPSCNVHRYDRDQFFYAGEVAPRPFLPSATNHLMRFFYL